MAITRGQMNREMYELGSQSPSINGRDRFGLGSFLRKIIPNEVAKVASVAAPFVAPFNPALAAGMAGLGSYDATGKLGGALKSGILTYGGGQLARVLGGAGLQGNPFQGGFGGTLQNLTSLTSPTTGQTIFGGFGTPTPSQEQLTAGKELSQIGQKTYKPVQPISGDMDQYADIRDYVVKTTPDAVLTPSEIAQQAGKTLSERTATEVSKSYGDLLKEFGSAVSEGDFTKIGQATQELGGKALKDIYTKPVPGEPGKTQLDKSAVLATLVTIPSYLDAKKVAKDAGLEENEFNEELYNTERDKYMKAYRASLTPQSFGIQQAANGGRIGYAEGTPREGIVSLTDEDSGVIYRDQKGNPITKDQWLKLTAEEESYPQYMSPTDQGSGVIYRDEQGNPISKEEWLRLTSEAPSLTLPPKKPKKEGIKSLVEKELKEETPNAYSMMKGLSPITYLRKYLKEKEIENRAQGGRIGYMYGSEVPVRKNQGGITELDYRNTGGFVPIGVKERADDVPAMLSKNEFVFTADAVRAAGGGSINKGAQRMYDTMKALENKVV